MEHSKKKAIGNRINAALASSNTLQKELARHLGVTDNTVSYWCSGSRSPNFEQMIEIAKYFNVSLDYLAGLTDSPSTDKDTRFICDYTGLSDCELEWLHNRKDEDYIVIDAGCSIRQLIDMLKGE